MKKILLPLFLLCVSLAQAQSPDAGREWLMKCIDAHGGLKKWQRFEGLEYTMTTSDMTIYQLTDLRTRHAYHRFPDFELGYDGKTGWATTDFAKIPGKSPLFYHNLDFYFFGLPFLLADPGTVHEYLGRQTVSGKEYEVVKVGFESGVGLVSDDVYIVYMDATTYQMEILRYSVTYFNRENADKFNAKVYTDWRAVQGLLVPGKMENIEWEDGNLGESKGYGRSFSDIHFLKKTPAPEQFAPPAGATLEQPQ
jgi:hypothetical protein